MNGITFWHVIGGIIVIFILSILLPSWVVVIVAGIPLALGLSGLFNRWFGASQNTTQRIVIVAAIAFLSSLAWNFGERQYPWLTENVKIQGIWRSFQATQAVDPQQPLGLYKATYDVQRDRIAHKQQKWAEILQGLRGGTNPSSLILENQLRNAGLMDDISPAAKEKIAAGTLCAEDVIQEAEAQRGKLQQYLEKIRLVPPTGTAPKPWLESIQQGPLWAKIFWPGLILLCIGAMAWLLPPTRKWGSRLVLASAVLILLGGFGAIADIKSVDQVPGLRRVAHTEHTSAFDGRPTRDHLTVAPGQKVETRVVVRPRQMYRVDANFPVDVVTTTGRYSTAVHNLFAAGGKGGAVTVIGGKKSAAVTVQALSQFN
jgi:hypothetical protein